MKRHADQISADQVSDQRARRQIRRRRVKPNPEPPAQPRSERGTDAEVAERTAGTRILEQAAADAGAKVASYLDVSLAMDEAGEDFFAEGELGDLHPGPAAYPRIAESIAAQVRACG